MCPSGAPPHPHPILIFGCLFGWILLIPVGEMPSSMLFFWVKSTNFKSPRQFHLQCGGLLCSGHEFVGEIVALGPGTENKGLKVGDRVLSEQIIPCECCRYCKSGDYNLCIPLGCHLCVQVSMSEELEVDVQLVLFGPSLSQFENGFHWMDWWKGE